MVAPLRPGKFYGSSLPRPRIYTEVKYSLHRVDPPAAVLDPLLSWAREAHWSMGGLSFKRLRLQGRIEGNVSKLRAEREKTLKKRTQISKDSGRKSAAASDSPPPAPIATKRRRMMALMDDEEDEDREAEEGETDRTVRRRRLVKKLKEEFDRVASESDGGLDTVSATTRSRRSEGGGDVVKKVVEEVNRSKSGGKKLNNRIRTSPRLAKSGLR